jgi:hypothetical protein
MSFYIYKQVPVVPEKNKNKKRSLKNSTTESSDNAAEKRSKTSSDANANEDEEKSDTVDALLGESGNANQTDAEKEKMDSQAQAQVVCKFFIKGQCRKGKHCRNIHDQAARDKAKELRAEKMEKIGDDSERPKGKGALYLPKPFAGGQRGTLLKNLLQDSISEEENVVLQCFRYISKNIEKFS